MVTNIQKISTIDSWKKARKLKLIRSSPCGLYQNQTLDKGVNYFILALEKIGCKTYYSCEGHFNRKHYIPEFYIMFYAVDKAIKLIRSSLNKYVVLEKGKFKNEYYIRIAFKNAEDKRKKLEALSKKWNKNIGPIDIVSNIFIK